MDETLDTKVAVKANHNLTTHASAQFIREARLLASLKHPNLPRVIDYFTEDDSQYLVMDFIPGDDLKKIIESKKEVSLPLVLKWATQLGNALSYLHTQNPPIYHRDIKPANIKLTPSGDVVLVDFGIAKTGEASTETQTGAWAFSPGFAPPEQVSGMRTGPYSDQFSLAATLYFLLAKKPPADSARRMMGEEEYVPLINIIPSLPPHFSAAIDKALSIKPDGRFSTVADFTSALSNPNPIPDPASAQQTVIATNRNIPPQVTPQGSTQSVAPGYPSASDSTPQVRKKASPVWLILGVVAVLGVLSGGFVILRSLGVFGEINSPAPTMTQEVALIEPATSTPEVSPTNTVELPTPTETATATAETPAFAPIGRGGKVAFISDRQGDGYMQIWLMEVGKDANSNLIAQNFQQLTFTPNDKSNPSWSPDGTKIIYSAWSSTTSANGTPFAEDIWMIDITNPGQEPIDLSQRAGNDLYASWSPTNQFIAFTSYLREDNAPQLVVMNPDGSDQKLLSIRGFSDIYTTWSADGEWLLYVNSVGNLDALYMISKYNILKKEDRNPEDFQKFDRSSDAGRLGNVMDPVISFDGSMIVYTIDINGKTNIATAVYTDRGRTTSKLTDTGLDHSPCWAPDGKWILFTSERDGDPEIYIMDPNGEKVTNLSNMPSSDAEPAWQPAQLQQ